MSRPSSCCSRPGGSTFLEALSDRRNRSYLCGYGHYGIFAALTALGAGLEVAVEQTGHHLKASPLAVGYAVAIPVGVFLTLRWAVHPIRDPHSQPNLRRRDRRPPHPSRPRRLNQTQT
ncbi:hypothetical protein GCM10009744_11120 [Kribbella alba]|uniref:Uncharacterized protein n=1 Tax=Kribbella alba TaxID=190197 RepID=A0ABN2F0L9_9ACTN